MNIKRFITSITALLLGCFATVIVANETVTIGSQAQATPMTIAASKPKPKPEPVPQPEEETKTDDTTMPGDNLIA